MARGGAGMGLGGGGGCKSIHSLFFFLLHHLAFGILVPPPGMEF